MKYNNLAIKNAGGLIYGRAPYPVTTGRGLKIGGGEVYSELNFTLPSMTICDETVLKIQRQYREIVADALKRAHELNSHGVIFEFETLPEMTMQPQMAVDLISIMNEQCEDFYQKHGFRSEIRITPNDTREFDRPPLMRTGRHLDNILHVFREGGKAGGDLFSIESTGGKEIHDEALTMGDIEQIVFALTVLGTRDMNFLWEKIVSTAKDVGRIAAGDTACGFGNTAMVLADRGYIPKTLAAIVRILTVVRTLPAYEQGAVGPDKDCAYEGPFIKAITGIPISMEGKSACCAHLSPVGNIAAACADLWSNESVQNIKLLGGMAPTVSMEQLEYDVRFFNQSLKTGHEHTVQKLLVDSDAGFDPQAFILAPENVIKISNAIVSGKNYIEAGISGAVTGLALIEEAAAAGAVDVPDREKVWIEMIRNSLAAIPADESSFVERMLPRLGTDKFIPAEYGL